MRKLELKYPGNCRRCDQFLSEKEEVMYEKSMGIFCIGHEPIETEDIRHFRTLKAQKRADQLETKAGKLESQAKDKMALFNSFRGDFAFSTQPGYIPIREKAIKRYEKGLELLTEAETKHSLAQGVLREKTKVAGDAERNRQVKREKNDSKIEKGTRIFDSIFGEGMVEKIYKKTYRVKFDRGFSQLVDKSHVKIIWR